MTVIIEANYFKKSKRGILEGSVIRIEGSGKLQYFHINDELRVFLLSESKILHGIRDRISKGLIGANISAIQFNVVCNQINNS